MHPQLLNTSSRMLSYNINSTVMEVPELCIIYLLTVSNIFHTHYFTQAKFSVIYLWVLSVFSSFSKVLINLYALSRNVTVTKSSCMPSFKSTHLHDVTLQPTYGPQTEVIFVHVKEKNVTLRVICLYKDKFYECHRVYILRFLFNS